MDRSKSYNSIFQARKEIKVEKKEVQNVPARWEALHNLAKVTNNKNDSLKNQIEILRNEKEMEECTFDPFSGKQYIPE